MTGRERVLAVLDGRAPDRTPFMPITMMFAADRAGVRYREYASDYRVLAEGQLRVAEEFDIDHVSCISDPAREAADLGAAIEWYDDQPPALNEAAALLKDKRALAALRVPDPLGGGRMHDRVMAAALLHERAGRDKIVEGWVEGPCAEAADLRGINTLMTDFLDDPAFVRDLFQFVVEMELRFARAQVEAGADLIGVGDAAASLVGAAIYEEFVFPYERRLVDGLHAMGARVRLHICGKTRRIFPGMGRLRLRHRRPGLDGACGRSPREDGCPPGAARQYRPSESAVPRHAGGGSRGNGGLRREAGPAFIAGAGCEVVRGTPAENLRAMRLA